MGANIEKSVRLKCCLNCDHILSVEHTIGDEVYCDGEKGNFVVIRAARDDALQEFASALQQLLSGNWNQ